MFVMSNISLGLKIYSKLGEIPTIEKLGVLIDILFILWLSISALLLISIVYTVLSYLLKYKRHLIQQKHIIVQVEIYKGREKD